MTAQDVWDELTNLRFNTQTIKLAQVKKWTSQAEIALWNAADWSFKRMPMASLTVIGGAATEPTDLGKVHRVYDINGVRLPYMLPDDFEEAYIAPTPAPTGVAEAYTVINRQITIGPSQSGTFKISYRRRYAHLNTGGSVVAGVMSVGTDTPIWDSEHHYILVPWAMRIGEILEADPTAAGMEQLIEGMRTTSMFQAMVEELAGENVDGETLVWGAAA